MLDNKLIVLLVLVLHSEDAMPSDKSTMNYSHPPHSMNFDTLSISL